MKTFNFKFVFVVPLIFLLFSCGNKSEEEMIRIVFYKIPLGVSKNIEEILKKHFLSNNGEKLQLKFEEINERNKLKERVEKDKNISLVFSSTTHLPFETESVSPFDISLYETFPSCVKRYSFEDLGKNALGGTSLPILLDTYHLFFNNLIVKRQGDVNFSDMNNFLSLLKEISIQAKYPLLCAGGEDETLLFFVASVMQMVGDVYSIGNKKIKSLKDRDEVFNASLELIVEWQKSGFLHPEWFRLKHRDISMFMDLKEIGMLFSRMSEYNKMSAETKNFYSLMPYMPLSKNSSLNGLPISVVSIIEPIQKEENTTAVKNNYISNIIEYCISVEGQRELTRETNFESSNIYNTNQRGNSSVRYLLATASVVLQDAGSILLEDSIDSSILANEIRDYFQVNGVGY
jgi:hypothetical protein